MQILRIEGGNPLRGEIEVGGSKNSALAILSSVVLGSGQSIIRNVPVVSDTRIKGKLLECFGAKVAFDGTVMKIDPSELSQGNPDEEMVRSIRTSFYMLGPLLARLGKVTLPAPGGCKIGARPVGFHLKGLALMGADVQLKRGSYVAEAKQLKGAEIYFDFPSAGATQHLMATATLAKGHTIIQNAAMEPEIIALANFLNRMGAKIEGAGTSTVTIHGVSQLGPADFSVPADRMQAGTFLLAGAITGGDVTVNGILPEEQIALINKIREAGAEVFEGNSSVRVRSMSRLKSTNVKTMPHPGFPTDMQQPMAATLALSEGTSIIEETVYESRIGHIQELNRMGADIRGEGRMTFISGVEALRGAMVEASDLRAGAALVLAGLVATGTTVVKNIHFIDRGYEDLEVKLRSLGGKIERVSASESEHARASENLL